MKTNKEIVTEIIDNLDIAFIPRARITKIALIECWSEYRRESDYKYYKYTASESASRIYIRMFKSITNKPSAEKWKSYILRMNGYKYCSKCAKLYTLNNFVSNKTEVSGLAGQCTYCKKEHYIDNKEKILITQKLYTKNNKQKISDRKKLYRLNNLESCRTRNNLHYKNNKEMYIANAAKRRAAKLKRTPSWLSKEDQLKIKDLYIQAKRLEKLHEVKYHVDHKIPLQGELVSGLHVFSNLQVIPAKENLSKGNTYTIG